MSIVVDKKHKRRLFRMHWVDWIIYICLFLFAVITFYLLWYVIIGSFSNGQMYASGGVYLWPTGFTLANYEVVFQDTEFWISFRNTVLRTATGIVAELIFTAIVAYAMTSKHLRCKKAYYWIFIFTMFFSGGIVPMYLLLRIIGLYDTFWVYIIPSIFSVYNMIIISNFYKGIPDSLRASCASGRSSTCRSPSPCSPRSRCGSRWTTGTATWGRCSIRRRANGRSRCNTI